MEIAIGFATGLGAIAFARALRWQSWYYTVSLLLLPIAYAAFAAFSDHWGVAWKEMLLGVPFFIAAIAFTMNSVRRSAIVIAILWLVHGVYDLWGGEILINPGVPTWYRAFCAAVDLVIGMYLLLLSRTLVEGDIRNIKV